MPAPKTKFTSHKKIAKKASALQTVIDYQRIILLVGPFIIIGLTLLIFYFIETNAWPKIRDFLFLKKWQEPPQSSQSATTFYEDDPTAIIEEPPPLPTIDTNQEATEILAELDQFIRENEDATFTLAIVKRIYTEAYAELQKGNEIAAKEKVILGYQLGQEMYAAYQNKLIRFRESTSSAE